MRYSRTQRNQHEEVLGVLTSEWVPVARVKALVSFPGRFVAYRLQELLATGRAERRDAGNTTEWRRT